MDNNRIRLRNLDKEVLDYFKKRAIILSKPSSRFFRSDTVIAFGSFHLSAASAAAAAAGAFSSAEWSSLFLILVYYPLGQ